MSSGPQELIFCCVLCERAQCYTTTSVDIISCTFCDLSENEETINILINLHCMKSSKMSMEEGLLNSTHNAKLTEVRWSVTKYAKHSETSCGKYVN